MTEVTVVDLFLFLFWRLNRLFLFYFFPSNDDEELYSSSLMRITSMILLGWPADLEYLVLLLMFSWIDDVGLCEPCVSLTRFVAWRAKLWIVAPL